MERLKALWAKLMGKSGKPGFTLIEVVIVLAIAGLIFVVVFLAVSGAQRGRRDNARKQAAGRLVAAAEQVASNTANGTLPADCTAIGTAYNQGNNPCVNADITALTDNITYAKDKGCASATAFGAASANPGKAAALYWSEGTNGPLCLSD